MKRSASDARRDLDALLLLPKLRLERQGRSLEGIPGVEGEVLIVSVHPPEDEEEPAERLSDEGEERDEVSSRRCSTSDCALSAMIAA